MAKKEIAIIKLGRPKRLTDELLNLVCLNISNSHKSLRTICKELKIAPQTVLNELNTNETFIAQYARAKEEQADLLAEEIIEMADDKSLDYISGEFGLVGNPANVQRSRLQVEARKWVAAKLKPKKYGDQIKHDISIHQEQPLLGE